MFDIGFVELLICGVIALIVLGPERLPTAARAAGRWVGAARRMVSQFSSELDSQLKAEELRKELREAGDIGLEDVQKSVRGALDEAKKYEHMVMPDNKTPRQRQATRETGNTGTEKTEEPREAQVTEQYEADEDPAAANNSGHSSLDRPEDPAESGDPSPDKRT
ncbi:Sec-independent protein translocase protein TatB [Marinobacter sp.]|uniref:Sec-independent protein translocase protein TatB n=1 Tax=Marinobacter sp. TaxID=50741 RepID=UPI002B4A9C98|nr:Sec-independent protein translocase protein TatB [Marinobacter sp.]HKK55586.1 Sec-independent protein translocase protein TatB [Marinobacter sp.]